MNRKAVFFLPFILSLFCVLSAYGDDWTLGAAAFTFSQKGEHSKAQVEAASLLPQLILEQLTTGAERLPTDMEMMDRTLESYLTKRNSLFLQLSKEVKTRDSLFLTGISGHALKKKLAEQEKKIKDLQKQIDENLNISEKVYKEYEERISEKKKPSADEFFSDIFHKSDEKLIARQENEKIKLYKNDSSSLFSVDEKTVLLGPGSRDYERSVNSAKINGLVTGTFTIYGGYCAVRCELYIYPGARSAGVVTEVGTIDDCLVMARNIARYLQPVIVNSQPVHLYFDLQPEEALKTASVNIDGSLYEDFTSGILIQSGIHCIEIYSKGYNKQAVTYDFSGRKNFLLHSNMVKEQTGTLDILLKKPFESTFFANGKQAESTGPGKVDSLVEINGESIIGLVLTNTHSVRKVRKTVQDEKGNSKIVTTEEEGPLISSFFYVPQNMAVSNAQLTVNLDPVDNASNIDKRRIWMYRGYSALICTLPVTFFCMGNYKAASTAYVDGYMTDYNTCVGWYSAQTVSLCVTAAAGGFFIYEIVRYLMAADKVIPAAAKTSKPGEMEASLKKSYEMEEQKKAALKSSQSEEEKTKEQGDGETPQDQTETSGQTENQTGAEHSAVQQNDTQNVKSEKK